MNPRIIRECAVASRMHEDAIDKIIKGLGDLEHGIPGWIEDALTDISDGLDITATKLEVELKGWASDRVV